MDEREAMNLKIISSHRAHNIDSLDYGGYSYILQYDDAEYLWCLFVASRLLSLCAQHPDYACQVLVLEIMPYPRELLRCDVISMALVLG